jgi:hypothetical protein
MKCTTVLLSQMQMQYHAMPRRAAIGGSQFKRLARIAVAAAKSKDLFICMGHVVGLSRTQTLFARL